MASLRADPTLLSPEDASILDSPPRRSSLAAADSPIDTLSHDLHAVSRLRHREDPPTTRSRSRRRRNKTWKKLLWVKQSYPDNYTDQDTFLEHLQRNPRLQPYHFWPLVADSTTILQHVCSVIIFVVCFVGIFQERVSPVAIVSWSSFATALGWLLWDWWVGREQEEEAASEREHDHADATTTQPRPAVLVSRYSASNGSENKSESSRADGSPGRQLSTTTTPAVSRGTSRLPSAASSTSNLASHVHAAVSDHPGPPRSTPEFTPQNSNGSGSGSNGHPFNKPSHSTSTSSLVSNTSYASALGTNSGVGAGTGASTSTGTGTGTTISTDRPHLRRNASDRANRVRARNAAPSRTSMRLSTVKSAILIYFTLLGLSPILKSLTRSTSSDSIWAMSCWLLALNIFFFDYSSTWEGVHRIPVASLSTNAALMASTVLASRLPSTGQVFSLTLFSIEVFGLFPVFRRYARHRSWRYHVAISVLLVLGAGGGVGMILAEDGPGGVWPWRSGLLGMLIACLLAILAMGGCSWWFIGLQKYKNEIYGPWDPARPIIISRRQWDD